MTDSLSRDTFGTFGGNSGLMTFGKNNELNILSNNPTNQYLFMNKDKSSNNNTKKELIKNFSFKNNVIVEEDEDKLNNNISNNINDKIDTANFNKIDYNIIKKNQKNMIQINTNKNFLKLNTTGNLKNNTTRYTKQGIRTKFQIKSSVITESNITNDKIKFKTNLKNINLLTNNFKINSIGNLQPKIGKVSFIAKKNTNNLISKKIQLISINNNNNNKNKNNNNNNNKNNRENNNNNKNNKIEIINNKKNSRTKIRSRTIDISDTSSENEESNDLSEKIKEINEDTIKINYISGKTKFINTNSNKKNKNEKNHIHKNSELSEFYNDFSKNEDIQSSHDSNNNNNANLNIYKKNIITGNKNIRDYFSNIKNINFKQPNENFKKPNRSFNINKMHKNILYTNYNIINNNNINNNNYSNVINNSNNLPLYNNSSFKQNTNKKYNFEEENNDTEVLNPSIKKIDIIKSDLINNNNINQDTNMLNNNYNNNINTDTNMLNDDYKNNINIDTNMLNNNYENNQDTNMLNNNYSNNINMDTNMLNENYINNNININTETSNNNTFKMPTFKNNNCMCQTSNDIIKLYKDKHSEENENISPKKNTFFLLQSKESDYQINENDNKLKISNEYKDDDKDKEIVEDYEVEENEAEEKDDLIEKEIDGFNKTKNINVENSKNDNIFFYEDEEESHNNITTFKNNLNNFNNNLNTFKNNGFLAYKEETNKIENNNIDEEYHDINEENKLKEEYESHNNIDTLINNNTNSNHNISNINNNLFSNNKCQIFTTNESINLIKNNNKNLNSSNQNYYQENNIYLKNINHRQEEEQNPIIVSDTYQDVQIQEDNVPIYIPENSPTPDGEIEETPLPITESNSESNDINDENYKEIYLLELNENGLPINSYKNKIFTCNKNSLIIISLFNGIAISNNISLITNGEKIFPDPFFIDKLMKESQTSKYDNEYFYKLTNNYRKFPYKINTSIYFKIKTKNSGNISIFFMYNDIGNKIKFTEPFYILINPIIEIDKNINININEIKLQTVISKNIGKISEDFENYYKEISLLGYNFIHFKTLQTLSSTDNLYSIKNHNELNLELFTEEENINLSSQEKYTILESSLKFLKSNYGIASITDLILTQTSTESRWMIEHPECGYNLENSPWLTVAYELDKILVNYSEAFYEKKVECNCAPFINNEKDLNEVMEEISKIVIKNNFEEFFLINMSKNLTNFKNFYKIYKNFQNAKTYNIKTNMILSEVIKEYELREMDFNNIEKIDEKVVYDLIYQSCEKYGYKRYGVEMPTEFVSLLIIEKNKRKNNKLISEYEFLNEIKKYNILINKDWNLKSKEMIRIALLNIKEFIRYRFLQLGKVGIKKKLIDNYFHVIDENIPQKILLCNGWIMQSEDENNLYPDITAYGTWYFFKRKVIIWKDTIKINYGDDITNTSNFLITYMDKYINNLSKIFDGFFIESMINVPFFILKYFIYNAKKINPNILLITQLPLTDDESSENDEKQKNLEKKYSEILGINLFVHEIIWDTSNKEIMNNIFKNIDDISQENYINFDNNLYSISKKNENDFEYHCYKYLTPKKTHCIFYDLTQDNQSYYEKYNLLSIQSAMLGSISLLNCSIGSTRGFDQLFPYQVSSQKEKRLYNFDNNEFISIINKISSINFNIKQNEFKEVLFVFNVKEQRNFKYKIDNIKLALSFHDWEPDILMKRKNKDKFTAKVKLPIGKHYYKYLLNDKLWTCDFSKQIEIDQNNNMNNVLDLTFIENIQIPDLKLLRCYINTIRENLKNKNTETYINQSNDLLCVMRILTEKNSLINENIEISSDIIAKYKNIKKEKFSNNINDNLLENIFDDNDNLNKENNNMSNPLIGSPLNLFEGYVMICRPVSDINNYNNEGKGKFIIPGKISDFICGFIFSNNNIEYDLNNILNDNYLIGIRTNINFIKDMNYLSSIATINYINNKTILNFYNMPTNSVLIFKFKLESEIQNAISTINNNIRIIFNKGEELARDKIDIYDINKILFSTENEERDSTFRKRGTFELKQKNNSNENKIKFLYSGLTELIEIIKNIKKNNSPDLKSLLYENISENDDLLKYTLDRINNINTFYPILIYIKENILKYYKKLPQNIKTYFFESLIYSLYHTVIKISFKNLPSHIINFGNFSKKLSLTKFEFISKDLSQNISISKGFPNNEVGFNRMYLRDLLISFRSLFLISKFYNDAKNILKIIASSLRHGLIPDRFDSGKKPRYNSRDTCWYFINAIKDYINFSKDYKFLQEKINLIFLSDISNTEHLKKKSLGEQKIYTIEEIIHIIFQTHANGIHFTEWENSYTSDPQLYEEGYIIDIKLNPKNGFIYGGNCYNCGTWMNNIGISTKAKNNKYPSNSRDGADIEIISLLYSCLDFVVDMSFKKRFKYKGVILKNGANYPYTQWKLLIKDNFEDNFFTKNNIYKDFISFNNKNIDNKKYEYQLRPNLLIAMYISPELFTTRNVIKVIENVENFLIRNKEEENGENIIGIKTLDKTDDEYCGTYNKKDTSNYFSSCGFNLHNGLEYLYLYAIYLIIKIKFFVSENKFEDASEEDVNENQEKIKFISKKLIPVIKCFENNKWFGLPEMTDEYGNIIKEGNQSCLKANCMFFELMEIISKLDINKEESDDELNFDSSNFYQ